MQLRSAGVVPDRSATRVNRRSVADYYDRRTRRFLGPQAVGAATESLHRAVWGPGAITRSDALLFCERLIAEQILRSAPDGPLWDLGCGVGAVTERLAAVTGREAFGLTVSPLQASLAQQAGRAVVRGDFTSSTDLIALRQLRESPVAAALFIESLVHATAPHTVFTDLASHLAPGGVILVCDDVLLRDPATAHEHALLQRWQRGWRLGHVASVQSFFDAAASAGFTPLHQRDLTPWLRLYRWRDALVALGAGLTAPLAGRSSWMGNLRGGAALTQLTRRGVVGYRLLVVQKNS